MHLQRKWRTVAVFDWSMAYSVNQGFLQRSATCAAGQPVSLRAERNASADHRDSNSSNRNLTRRLQERSYVYDEH